MLSFGCGLQQVCPKSLVLPCLDLTRFLELLLDLQLLRLCSERIKGKWGRGEGGRRGTTRGKEEKEEGDRSRDRERERNRKHVRQRGRGELYTDRHGEMELLRDQESLHGQERQRNKRGSEYIRVAWDVTRRDIRSYRQGTENLRRTGYTKEALIMQRERR